MGRPRETLLSAAGRVLPIKAYNTRIKTIDW